MSKNEAYKDLVAALGEMKSAKFNATNPHFKSKYADLNAVRDATLPSLAKHNLAIIQSPTMLGDEFVLRSRMVHASGEVLDEAFYPLPKGGKPHQVGSEITYARRYTWAALCGIASEEDDDGNAGMDNNQPRTQPKTERPKTKVGEEVRSACYAMGQAQTNAALDKIIDHQKYKALEAECSKDWPDFKQSLDETLKVNRQRLVQAPEPTSEDVEYTTDQYCQKVKAAKTDAEANTIAQEGIRALLNNGADAQYIKAIEDSLKGR